MKQFIYSLVMFFVPAAGWFIGVAKGREARHKWVSKMKFRFAGNDSPKITVIGDEVMLDDIEMASFHSN